MLTDEMNALWEEVVHMPFPVEEWGMLAGLAERCGMEDLGFLCAVCYLYGLKKGREEMA